MEFVLIPLESFKLISNNNPQSNPTNLKIDEQKTHHEKVETIQNTNIPEQPVIQGDYKPPPSPVQSTEPTQAAKTEELNREWLHTVSELKNQPDSSRKKRISKLLSLIIDNNHITFNFSSKSIVLGESNSINNTTSLSVGILSFLRDLQTYQKKVPSKYFVFLNQLFPPTDVNAEEPIRELIKNRFCLNYLLTRHHATSAE